MEVKAEPLAGRQRGEVEEGVVRGVVVVRELDAVNYGHDWAPISAVSCRNGSETIIGTADNSPTAHEGLKLHVRDNKFNFHALHAHI